MSVWCRVPPLCSITVSDDAPPEPQESYSLNYGGNNIYYLFFEHYDSCSRKNNNIYFFFLLYSVNVRVDK